MAPAMQQDALGEGIRNEARVDKRLTGEERQIDVVVGPQAGVGLRLDRYLAAALPTLSRSLLKRWLEHGWCLVDGQRGKASHRVHSGEHIELRCPLPPDATTVEQPPPLDLLYDEDGVLACNKAPGVLAHQAGRVLHGTLLNQLQDLVARRGGDPAEVRLVNRIDRDTSGILLATADEAVHRRLSIALQRGRLHKEYRALCVGVPTPESGHWREPIGDDPTGSSIARCCRSDGQASDTEYQVLERADADYAMLRVVLHTGRQHQIRVHAAHNGHPLLGDWVYGAPCDELDGQALHAAQLHFPHPRRDEMVRIEAPLPARLSELWRALRAGGRVTPRALRPDEHDRLGRSADAAEQDDRLPQGWRRPSWLSDDELRAIQAEEFGKDEKN